MSPKIEEAFGVAVEREMDDVGRWHIKLPPPRVLAVLGNIAARREQPAPGHGGKTKKRRSKRARLRRRERFLQRQTWRAFHEEEKRRAKEEA